MAEHRAGSRIDKFIRRENLTLFSRRFADPTLTEAQRKLILRLLSEGQVKGQQERGLDLCQSTDGKLLASGIQLNEPC